MNIILRLRYDVVGLLMLVSSLLFLLCFDYLSLFSLYDQWRIISLLLLSYLVVIAGVNRTVFKNIPSRILVFGFYFGLSVLTLGLLSSAFSPYFFVSFWCVTDALIMFACVFVVCDMLLAWVDTFLDALVAFIILVLVVLSIQFTVGYFAGLSAGSIDRSLFFGRIVNVRFLNQFQTIVLPLVFFYRLRRSYNKYYVLDIVLVIQLVVLFVFGSRGSAVALLSCIVLGCLLGVLTKKACAKIGILLLGASAAYFICFIIVPHYIFDYAVDTSIRTSSSGRLLLWRDGIDMLNQNGWLFGTGGMGFIESSVGYKTSHPHNFLMHVLIEWGVLMLSLVFLLLFLFFRSVLRLHQGGKFTDPVLSAITLALAAGLVHGLFSGIFIMPIPQILMLILVSLYLSLYIKAFEVGVVMGCSRRMRWVVVSFLSFSMLFVAVFSLSWRFNLDGSYRYELIEGTGPRYWVDGALTPIWFK